MKRMTPDIEASRRIDRDHAGGLHGSCMASICAERPALLAEVDRLEAEVRIRAHHGESWADGRDKERARILARVEGLPDAFADGWHGECMDRADVIDAIEGETKRAVAGMEWPARCLRCGFLTEDPDAYHCDDPDLMPLELLCVTGAEHHWAPAAIKGETT